jgi:hypothetical protein
MWCLVCLLCAVVVHAQLGGQSCIPAAVFCQSQGGLGVRLQADAPASCTLGSTVTITAWVSIETVDSTVRYDVAFYLAQSGGDAHDAGSRCYRDHLRPIQQTGQACRNDGGPFLSANNNSCGDLGPSCAGTSATSQPMTLSMVCMDNDKNGLADVSLCVAWTKEERGNCGPPFSPDPLKSGGECHCRRVDVTSLSVVRRAALRTSVETVPRICENASIEPIGPLCSNDQPQTIVGSPPPTGVAQAVYAIDGVNITDPLFDPALVGIGVHNVHPFAREHEWQWMHDHHRGPRNPTVSPDPSSQCDC